MAWWTDVGHAPRVLPRNIMFVYYTNENFGFTANLVVGTNETEAFAMPLPATINIFTQTVVWHKIQFLMNNREGFFTEITPQVLKVHLSYLDREFAATFDGTGADAEDENLKAQFDGPFTLGQSKVFIVITARESAYPQTLDNIQNLNYTPPVPLDASHPLYIQLTNQSATITAATGAAAELAFSLQESVAIRGWFTVRNLSPSEMQARNTAMRFQRLSS